jgi:hypothetical protein
VLRSGQPLPLEPISVRQTTDLDIGTTTLLDRGRTEGTQESVQFHPPAPSSHRALTRLVPLSQRAQQLRPRPLNHIQIDLIHRGRTVTAYPLVPSLHGAPTLFRRILVHPRRMPLRKLSSRQLGFIQMTLAIFGIEKGLALALRPLPGFRNLPISGGDDSKRATNLHRERCSCLQVVRGLCAWVQSSFRYPEYVNLAHSRNRTMSHFDVYSLGLQMEKKLDMVKSLEVVMSNKW